MGRLWQVPPRVGYSDFFAVTNRSQLLWHIGFLMLRLSVLLFHSVVMCTVLLVPFYSLFLFFDSFLFIRFVRAPAPKTEGLWLLEMLGFSFYFLFVLL